MNRFGLTLLTVFFMLATLLLILAGASLVWPGTVLDQIWRLTPDKREQLEPFRLVSGVGFLSLAPVMAVAALGCLNRPPWARWTAIVIFAINGAGDLAQAFVGRWLEAVIGVSISLMLIVSLLMPSARAAFDGGDRSNG